MPISARSNRKLERDEIIEELVKFYIRENGGNTQVRTMGLDVGSKTVGIAISDALGWTAQGIETIQIDENAGHSALSESVNLLLKSSP